MKIFQKFIVFLVIINLIISPVFNILVLRPKQVKALDAGGSWGVLIKETILDAIGWTISDMILKPLEQKIINWGLGRKSDANEPFAVSDWAKYFLNALDISSAKFVQEFDLTKYCQPIRISLGTRFQFTTYSFDRPTYSRYAACTIGDIVNNVEDFYRNPQISVYGIDAWDALTQSNNNIFGSYFLAQERWEEIAEQEDRAADKTTAVSGGIQNETATTKTDIEACNETCIDRGYDCVADCNGSASCEDSCNAAMQSCQSDCESRPGIAIQTKIKNWGADIHKQLDNAMSADLKRVISADEISELIGIIFSALLNKTIDGLGMAFSALTSTTQQRQRAERKDTYTYQREFKKTLTPTAIKGTRSQILTNIQKGIQQLDRSIIACKEAEMMPYTDWTKNIADILAANVEALYVGLEGVNLKPDFEVLDPRFAPYTTYGYSWGEVPRVKIPDKCRTVIEQFYTDPPNNYSEATAKSAAQGATCQTVTSGLEPPTPTLTDLRADGTTTWTTNPTESCSRCMYDHDSLNCPPGPYPPQPYPLGTNPVEPWSDLVSQQKGEFWWWCKGTYNTTINRCDECLKKVDEKCAQNDPIEKNICITNVCANYTDLTGIIQPITSPLDFYAKCLIEEKKEACYTCLKEYYMPSAYCEETGDYISRSIMKYPAVVKRVRAGGDDKGEIWGPAQQDILGRGDECDDNTDAQPLNLAMLCRIMPDYGNGLCRTCMSHGMTEEQLLDITDFRPNDIDCNRATVSGGGRNPYNPVSDGVNRVRGKCCGAFSASNPSEYAICVGGGTGEEKGLCKKAGKWWLRPECWCKDNERPLGEISTSRKPLACCPTTDGGCWGATDYQQSPTCRTACGNFQFTVPNGMAGISKLIVRTNPAPGGSVISISTEKCTNPNDSMCYYGMSNPSLYERLAEIFKPLLLFTAYAQGDCNCDTAADCAEGERCRHAGTGCLRRGEDHSGICEEAGEVGNCNCNNDADCSGDTPVCDLPEPGEDQPCRPGDTGMEGVCIAGDPENPGCDPATCLANDGYTGTPPGSAFCKQEAHNSRGAETCCTDDGWPIIGGGGVEISCNLSGQAGNNVWLSVTSDDFTDCKTTATLCVPCNPSDQGYPYYGIKDSQGNLIDQCTGKIPENLR